MASATGSHPDTGSSVRPLPGSTNNDTPGRRPVLQHAENAPLDRKRLRSGMRTWGPVSERPRRVRHGQPARDRQATRLWCPWRREAIDRWRRPRSLWLPPWCGR